MRLDEAVELQGIWQELCDRSYVQAEPYVVETITDQDFPELYTTVNNGFRSSLSVVQQKYTGEYLLARRYLDGKVQIIAQLVIG